MFFYYAAVVGGGKVDTRKPVYNVSMVTYVFGTDHAILLRKINGIKVFVTFVMLIRLRSLCCVFSGQSIILVTISRSLVFATSQRASRVWLAITTYNKTFILRYNYSYFSINKTLAIYTHSEKKNNKALTKTI